MKLIVGARAVADIERIDAWWRANRPDAPDAFLHGLDAAKRTITDGPTVAPVYARAARGVVRRVLLSASGHHVYFRVEPDAVVRVVAVWGARRGAGPRLR